MDSIERERRKSNKFHPQLDHKYELVDGRCCTIKFMGETHFAQGTWYGVMLDEESGPGKNDGQIGSKRYFKTTKNPPRGLFVRRSKLVREVHERAKKVGPRATNRSTGDWKPAAYQVSDTGSFLGKKGIPSANVEKRQAHDSSIRIVDGKIKKLGPRDIAKAHAGDWKPAKYEVSDTGAFLSKKFDKSGETNIRETRDTQHKVVDGKLKKVGPRDIDKSHAGGWKPAQYKVSDTGAFLQKRFDSRISKDVEVRDQSDSQHVVVDGKLKKLGPRQIGRHSDPNWKPAKFDIQDDNKDWLSKRFGSSSNVERRDQVDAGSVYVDGKVKKLGPRQIGRLESDNWKPAKFDVKDDGKDFLAKKGVTKAILDKREQHDASVVMVDGKFKKLGPRQIGRHTDPNWKPANYKTSDTGAFLQKKYDRKYNVEVREKRETGTVERHGKMRKMGPRDVSRPDTNWKPATYDISDQVSVEPAKGAGGGAEAGYVIVDGKRRALGPRDIGTAADSSNWRPAKYDGRPARAVAAPAEESEDYDEGEGQEAVDGEGAEAAYEEEAEPAEESNEPAEGSQEDRIPIAGGEEYEEDGYQEEAGDMVAPPATEHEEQGSAL